MRELIASSIRARGLSAIAYSLAALLFAMAFTKSAPIAIAVAMMTCAMIILSRRRSEARNTLSLRVAIPEIVDHVISGIQSGLSLSESLNSLSARGPSATRSNFERHRLRMAAGSTFEESVAILQEEFSLRSADQLFESLLFAKSLGGTELVSMLRQLGDFTRQDLALRQEIEAKQSWIRNSAHLSAAAPWLLLLLLSTQSSTAESYATSGGITVLFVGIAMTLGAYLWMGRLARMPESPRIFGRR